MSEPAVIKSAVLAERLGIDRSTLLKWYGRDAALAGCILRRTRHSTYWSVQRLRDRGFLTKPDGAQRLAAPASNQAEAV